MSLDARSRLQVERIAGQEAKAKAWAAVGRGEVVQRAQISNQLQYKQWADSRTIEAVSPIDPERFLLKLHVDRL